MAVRRVGRKSCVLQKSPLDTPKVIPKAKQSLIAFRPTPKPIVANTIAPAADQKETVPHPAPIQPSSLKTLKRKVSEGEETVYAASRFQHEWGHLFPWVMQAVVNESFPVVRVFVSREVLGRILIEDSGIMPSCSSCSSSCSSCSSSCSSCSSSACSSSSCSSTCESPASCAEEEVIVLWQSTPKTCQLKVRVLGRDVCVPWGAIRVAPVDKHMCTLCHEEPSGVTWECHHAECVAFACGGCIATWQTVSLVPQ